MAPAGADGPPAGSGPLPLATALRSALSEFAELTGRLPESVTGIRATDSGWSVLADVVELERVPGSTSVMAVYRVDVGQDGHLIGCERLRRFHRGATDLG